METTTVYRLEHRQLKTGPWNSVSTAHDHCLSQTVIDDMAKVSYHLNCVMNRNEFTHPIITDDCFSWSPSDLCGTACVETLNHWFGGDRELVDLLKKADFVIRKYVVDVKNIKRGASGVQVLFNPAGIVADETEELDFSILLD